jgi:hypothetical protein
LEEAGKFMFIILFSGKSYIRKNKKGGVMVAKNKEQKMKKKTAKALAQNQMEQSSAKNPDDFQVKGSE